MFKSQGQRSGSHQLCLLGPHVLLRHGHPAQLLPHVGALGLDPLNHLVDADFRLRSFVSAVGAVGVVGVDDVALNFGNWLDIFICGCNLIPF